MIVLQNVYQNAHGIRIEPGVYASNAPELHGLGAYLLETDQAQYVFDPEPEPELEQPTDLTEAQRKAAEALSQELDERLLKGSPDVPPETPPTEENPAESEGSGSGEPTPAETPEPTPAPEPPAATGKGNKAKGKAEDKS